MLLAGAGAMNTQISFTKITVIFSIVTLVTLGNAVKNTAYADTILKFPIPERLQHQGKPLANETIKWMNRWRGIDLDNSVFKLDELSGSTSIYLKVRKLDVGSKDGYKAYGTFMSRSWSANPYSELAYFNLATILGHDNIFRPAVRYALGPKARQAFKVLLEQTVVPPGNRLDNKNLILQDIATGKPLNGCLKAKKQASDIAYNAITDIKASPNGHPRMNNPIIAALQAANAQPVIGQKIELLKGYKGDIVQLAREYSIIMTLDVIFQQWDRYSGDNVALAKDKFGVAHFYSTDNNGASLENDTSLVLSNLKLFSRYDRKTINQLKALYGFLLKPAKGFFGYRNAELFVVDLGLYDNAKPSEYVQILKQNLKLLLNNVAKVESRFGKNAYLP
jgi:hypothetical protein